MLHSTTSKFKECEGFNILLDVIDLVSFPGYQNR